MTLEQLTQQLLDAAAAEKQARELRVQLEAEILRMVEFTKDEGSAVFSLGNGRRLRATSKLSYKADATELMMLTMDWLAEMQPAYLSPVVDETRLKTIRRDHPDMWAKIARAVEIKPVKTRVSIIVSN